jgi:uncharacterized repeat protein (TIGR02543 family)
MSKKNAVKTAGRLYPLLAALFFVITSCGDQDPFFIPVKSINGVPNTGTAGTPLPLTGTVSPAFASNNAIVWLVGNAGNTGASISGNILNTESDGTVLITAKVVNGTAEGRDYTQNFFIVFTEEGGSPEIPVIHTVTFFNDDGSIFDSQSVKEGEMAQEPPNDPVKAGWYFNYWYKDSAGSPYNFNTPVTGNISLYAKWTEVVSEANAVAKIELIYYKTLYEAVNNASSGSPENPTVITILKDITEPENGMSGGYTIPDNKHIKLTVATGQNLTITAYNGNFNLFRINSGSSLTLEGGGAGKLILNGGGTDSTGDDRLGVYVYGGTFIMNNGVTIKDFNNINNGGGVYIHDGIFNMNGGNIADNKTTGTGNGGGVFVFNGTFNMNGGEISRNVVNNNGGGVYINGGTSNMNGGTFNMNGGTIYGTDIPNESNKVNGADPNNGAAIFVGSFATAKYGGAYAEKGYGSGASNNNIITTDKTLPLPTFNSIDALIIYLNSHNNDTDPSIVYTVALNVSNANDLIGIAEMLNVAGKNVILDLSGSTIQAIPEMAFSYIYEDEFCGCDFLVGIILPDTVISIEKYAFYACNNITSVTIPNSVKSIGESAFQYCQGLTSVYIPDSVTSIMDGAFRYCTLLTAINVNDNNGVYTSDNGVLYNKNKTVLIQYPARKTGDSFIIPNNVTSIGNYAFECTTLNKIDIPNSVENIGIWAFGYNDKLTSVIIPNSVKSIGASAFKSCTSLATVTFQGTIPSTGFYAPSSTGTDPVFPGDLRDKFYATDQADGTPGIYTRSNNQPNTWIKQ